MELKAATQLYVPSHHVFSEEGILILLDGDRPNWVSTDERGRQLLDWIGEGASFGELVRRYSASQALDPAKAWLHVHDFVREAMRFQMVDVTPFSPQPYLGRVSYLGTARLREFWIHTNNLCNLTCTHCLVNSSPSGDRGLPKEKLLSMIDQAASLGVRRFYFTGGEPFVRQDLPELIHRITDIKNSELVILTNATLLKDRLLQQLDRFSRERLKFQVSLDGASPQTNDPIRGRGTFQTTTKGLKRLASLGFDISLTTVVTRSNLKDLTALSFLSASLGARAQHLMWLHRRGRILEDNAHPFPEIRELIQAFRRVKRSTQKAGVIFDNYESAKQRVNGRPGVKYDLGNAGWDSLCLYSDGHIYPSAATANHPGLNCGDALNGLSLEAIWLGSPVTRRIRTASLIQKKELAKDPFRFLTGGGDVEHSYFYSEGMQGRGDFLAPDPYYDLYVAMMKEAMFDWAHQKKEALNRRSGYDVPRIFHAMGEGAVHCGMEGEDLESQIEVRTLHSNCVLAFDIEKPRKLMREFYGKAAETPQTELCCPTKYDDGDISHIPKEVLERFYGCGSPMSLAGVRSGEVVVDLGSGAGIDCFIAAKKVGPRGKVVGVDMTDPMLEVARENQKKVAAVLGYDVVEFRKGYLEEVPFGDKSVDLVTSNCVINLSPDKKAVFREMWRILRDKGRVVVSDIVSDRPIPAPLKANTTLWGECTGGALTEEEFLSQLEQAGFYGLQVLKKDYWKEIGGYLFHSLTVQGVKFEKTSGCCFIGQKAIYRGPFKSVVDEEGHLFVRNELVEVCTDTAAKLKGPPYQAFFTVVEPQQTKIQISEGGGCCSPSGGGSGC